MPTANSTYKWAQLYSDFFEQSWKLVMPLQTRTSSVLFPAGLAARLIKVPWHECPNSFRTMHPAA